MDKSPDAFRTISEVAEHLETPAHVLRFWESRFPQIRPVKRAGGRRYYRPSDVSLLTGIKRLLHEEGMTIRGVQKILREQGVRHVSGLSGDAGFADTDADIEGDATFGDVENGVVDANPVSIDTRPMSGARDRPDDANDQPGKSEAKLVVLRPAEPTFVTPEPVQGALLLTPASISDPASGPVEALVADVVTPDLFPEMTDAAPTDRQPEPQISDLVAAALKDEGSTVGAIQVGPEPGLTPDDDSTSFDEDDFDDGPIIPLAARIRALPPGASAAQVGEGLLAVVSRLQLLRDRVVDATRSGRA
jgi:resuscitation-promoting factor RpfA